MKLGKVLNQCVNVFVCFIGCIGICMIDSESMIPILMTVGAMIYIGIQVALYNRKQDRKEKENNYYYGNRYDGNYDSRV